MTKNKSHWLMMIMGGVCLGFSFPPYPFGLLSFIGFIFFLRVFEEQPVNIFRKLYVAFWFYHGVINWWISSWRSETDPYLMVSGFAIWLAHPFFFMIPMIIYMKLRKRLTLYQSLAAFPFIWTAFEWAHSLGDFSYPWLSIGYSQILTPLGQIADIGGVWLISFIIVSINVLIFAFLYNTDKIDFKSLVKVPFRRNAILAAVILYVSASLYGLIQYNNYSHDKLMAENPKTNIGIIQPSINPWAKWEVEGIGQIYLHQNIQDSLIRKHKQLDLCIWSETAFPYLGVSINKDHQYGFVREALDAQQTALLTGFSEIYVYDDAKNAPATARVWKLDSSKVYEPFNAALLLNPRPKDYFLNQDYYDQTIKDELIKGHQIYRKSRLTPFAERIPYVEYFPFALNWLKWGVGISGWGKGSGPKAMQVKVGNKSYKIGTIICIESIYPGFCSDFVRDGAEVLSIITNDAWYDYTVGPRQHYIIGAARAIETRRYIARCANTGVSGFISPIGKSILEAEQYTKTGIAASVPILNGQSIYVKYGDVLPWICLIVIVGFVFVSKKNKIKAKI